MIQSPFNSISRSSGRRNKRQKNPEKFEVLKEAQTGFEPVDNGVADRCLTTWLLRHNHKYALLNLKMTPTGIEPVLPP